jgi:4-amino-4-deoxy-L-arabinose transferase-like glycosyltransferase
MMITARLPVSGPAARAIVAQRTLTWLAFAIGAGLIVRFALCASVRSVGLVTYDERQYYELAANLFGGRGFFLEELGRTSLRPPLFPAFMAVVWWFGGGPSYQAIRLAECLVAVATVPLVFVIARRMFDDRVAAVAAVIWSFYPSFLYAGVLLLTEVLFTFLLLAAVWLLIRTTTLGGKPLDSFGAGLAIGAAALTRSVLWPFPALAAGFILWSFRSSPRTGFRVVLLVLLGYALTVGPWAVRNTRLQGVPTIVDTMGGLNLRMGNFEFTREDRMWDGVSLKGDKAWAHQMFIEHPEAVHWTEGQKDKWAQHKALEYMRAHPWTTLRRSALKFADFWGLEREYVAALSEGQYSPPRWFGVASSAAVLFSYPAVMLLGLAGALTVPATDRRARLIALFVVLFVCALHSIVFGHSRYHLPLMPLVSIFAAAAIVHARWAAVPRSRRLLLGGLLLVFTAIWVRELAVRDAGKIAALLGRLA